MADQADETSDARVTGLLLTQQVLLEALIRHDAIGYHQLRDSLSEALDQLEAANTATDILAPLRQLLTTLENRHAPRPAGEPPHAIDWAAWLTQVAAR